MGFMDRFMAAARVQAAKDAEKKRKQAELNDDRPPMPEELEAHLNRECVRVWLNDDGLALADGKQSENIAVRVRKARKPELGAEYTVSLTDGTVIGTLSYERFLRSGVKTRGEVTAEVNGAVWHGMRYGTMHIPITSEELERQKMNVWIDVSADHWSGPDGQRVDATGGEILESRKGSGKPTYVIIGADTRLFEVTPRMACYAKIAERANLPLRRIIAESQNGEHGRYWHIGLHF